MNIGEIFIKLGFKADTLTLKDFGKQLSDIPLKALGAVGAIAGVSFEISHLISDAMDAAEGFKLFTAQTSLSTNQLQRWQFVAKQIGVSKDAVTGSLVGIDSAIGAIRAGHGDAQSEALGKLHIPWRGKDAVQINEELRKKFQSMTPAQVQLNKQFLGAAGSSEAMLPLYRMSDREFAGHLKGFRAMKENEIDNAAAFKEQIVRLAEILSHSINPLFGDLAKILKDLVPVAGGLVDTEVSALHKILNMTDEDWKNLDAYIANPSDPETDAYLKTHPYGKLGEWLGKFVAKAATDPAEASPAVAQAAEADFQSTRQSGRGQTIENHLTQNIHTNAPAHEVARNSISEHRRQITHAVKSTNKEGH